MTKAKIENRYTLLTNLDYVVASGVRTYTSALLVVREPSPFDERRPRHLIRGFRTQASLPTFDLEVPSDEFTLVDAHNPSFLVASEASGEPPRPLLREAIVRWAGMERHPDVSLVVDVNSPHGIDVHRFAAETPILQVWAVMERKIIQYWTAPFFPIVDTLPIDRVREALEIAPIE